MTDADGRRDFLRGERRGQSETIGYILLIAIAAIGVTGIVVLGSAAVEDSQHAMEVGSAEHAMTEFDSQASLVALGGSSSQIAMLPTGGSQSVGVDPNAGWMNITVYNQTTGAVQSTLMNKSLGAVAYENGGTTIAYQGGGVWKQTDAGTASMISPPEVHYQGTTLTLPLVLVQGTSAAAGQVRVTQNGTTDAVYPTATRSNPLERGVVSIVVQSDYYDAWGRYFEQRTSGDVTVDHESETTRINLTVPFTGNFGNTVATTESGGVTVRGGGGPSFDYETGVNYPPTDSKIETEINDCENGLCKNETLTIDSDGTYYWDSDFSGSITVDDPGGNVTFVVNGAMALDDLIVNNLSGDQTVTAYVRDDFTINDMVNDDDGDSGELQVLVHSDGDVELTGSSRFVGLLYAPDSSCEFRGSGSFEGAVVCETMTVRGGPASDFTFGEAVRSTDLNIDADVAQVTYLHVSATNVSVTAT